MKPTKQVWRVSVTTSAEAEDAVAELLGSLFGSAASAYFNLETGASFVSVYFPEKKLWSRAVHKQISAGLKAIENCDLNLGDGKIDFAKVKREDWAESWKKHFRPMEIGSALLVKPSWSKKRPRKNQVVVVLDPGLSFGTGQHPTTSFCLNEIVRHRRTKISQSFLDIGTGSGILAIAAAKLGYQPVHAFDFDPESVRIARVNARANKVLHHLRLTRGDVSKLPANVSKRYDLICANLISNLLIAERRRIVNRLARDGVLVLAGILAAEFLEVKKSFAALGLEMIENKAENEWRSGSFCFAKK